MIGVVRQRGTVHENRVGRHEPVLVHEADTVVAVGPENTRVGIDRDTKVASYLKCRALGEFRPRHDVKGDLEAQHVALSVEAPMEEVLELLVGRPLPRRSLDVPVAQDKTSGNRLEGVDCRVRVLNRLKPVRPVDGGRDPRVDGLDGREQIAGEDILRAKVLAMLEVVPHEVLRQRPVRAVRAHRRLPHVAVGVDHARHDNAASRVDRKRVVGCLDVRADLLDHAPNNEHVALLQDAVRVIHGQDQPIAEHDGTTMFKRLAGRTDGLVHTPPFVCRTLQISNHSTTVFSDVKGHFTGRVGCGDHPAHHARHDGAPIGRYLSNFTSKCGNSSLGVSRPRGTLLG